MFKSGRFVASHLGDLRAEQVQPNGVDLTLGAVFEQVEPGRIGRGDKRVGERRELDPTGAPESGTDGRAERGSEAEQNGGDANGSSDESTSDSACYRLDPGGYVVRYAERVSIPERHVGFLCPRSSLLRNSCMLETAVWDAGYEGRGEGLLEVYHPIELEPGARIAQLVLAEGAHEGTYEGDYQGEGLV